MTSLASIYRVQSQNDHLPSREIRRPPSKTIPFRELPQRERYRPDIEDSDYRIYQLIQRFLSIEIPMGSKRPPITVREILKDPEMRSLFFAKVRKRIYRKVTNLGQGLKDNYQAALADPKVAKAFELQQRHLSSKIVGYVLKILNALAKISVLPYGDEVQDINALVKFAKKAFSSADLFANLREIENAYELMYKTLKASYTGLSILINTVEVVNDNILTQGAYALAGWGAELQPIPEIVVDYCEEISPFLNIVRLFVKASGFKDAIEKYRSTEDANNPDMQNYKKWKVIRSGAELAGESLKIGFKGLLFVGLATSFPVTAEIATQTIPIISFVIAVSSASIGWVQTYSKPKSDKVSASMGVDVGINPDDCPPPSEVQPSHPPYLAVPSA